MKPYEVTSMITVRCNGFYKVFPFSLTVMADSEKEACKIFSEDVKFDVSTQGASKKF